MAEKHPLKAGQLVALERTNRAGQGSPFYGVLKSFSARALLIEPTPEASEDFAALRAGDRLRVIVSGRSKTGGQRSAAETEVTAVAKSGRLVWGFRRPADGSWTTIQDREHVRIAAPLPLRWRPLVGTGEDPGPWVRAQVLDLSASGALVKGLPLGEGMRFEAVMELGEGDVPLKCQVVRMPGRQHEAHNAVGITFTGINANGRERIVRYIFQRQLELRRKGLL